MNRKTVWVSILLFYIFLSVSITFAQEKSTDVTLRILTVDWYQYAGPGVKIQYRTYDNRPMTLYLPLSFESKLYRFVEAPKNAGDNQALPALLVHMKGSDVVFIDIYTRYMMEKGQIADFNQKDIENFAAAEKKGYIELIFH